MSQLGGGDGARVGGRAANAESKGQEAREGAARPGTAGRSVSQKCRVVAGGAYVRADDLRQSQGPSL